MKFYESMRPTKCIVTLFLILALFTYFFVVPFFSTCKAGGVACRMDEPSDVCQKRSEEYARNCEIFINTMTVIFLIPSYVISCLVINGFRKSYVSRFISNNFWKILSIGIVLTLVSVIRVEHETVPDLEQFLFGFPLPWLIHQTGSFAGPVSTWFIQWSFLYLDFVFWLLVSTVVNFIWNKYKGKKVL